MRHGLCLCQRLLLLHRIYMLAVSPTCALGSRITKFVCAVHEEVRVRPKAPAADNWQAGGGGGRGCSSEHWHLASHAASTSKAWQKRHLGSPV